jgi:hypothetical protein
MKTLTAKSVKEKVAIRIKTFFDEEMSTHVTDIRIRDSAEVATIDGYLHIWTSGREVKIGPLTAEQAEKLCEDLGYDAIPE